MFERVQSHEETQRRIDIVIDQGSGILPQYEAFYLQSILYAADASANAFERFSSSIVNDDAPFDIVSSIQEALTHAAGLSRFFWPARKSKLAQSRAQKLRLAFKMEDSALQQRDLRNALEHFDERLDEFLLQDPVGFFFPGPLVDSHTLADEAIGQIFRLVDPYEMKIVILGNKHDFLKIHDEVRRVLSLANDFDQNGSRLPLPDRST